MAIAVVSDGLDKTHEWWENYFSEGGGWERNGGRQQSRLFAEHFVQRFAIDRQSHFRLLDVGCALGDAIDLFHQAYPQAELHGVDFSAVAIARCKSKLGAAATFSVGDIDHVQGHFDVIYCSNTLEHFANYAEKAASLAEHCARLCILVPYKELVDGKALQPRANEHHQATFYDDSFDSLLRSGQAASIDRFVFSAPGAWGWTPAERVTQPLKNILRPLLGKQVVSEPFQVLYDIKMKPREAAV